MLYIMIAHSSFDRRDHIVGERERILRSYNPSLTKRLVTFGGPRDFHAPLAGSSEIKHFPIYKISQQISDSFPIVLIFIKLWLLSLIYFHYLAEVYPHAYPSV